jgi:TPR repeat protein
MRNKLISDKIIEAMPLVPQFAEEMANEVKNIKHLEALAVSGDLDIQLYLGCIYILRKRGYEKAVRLIKNAHEMGHVVASLILHQIWLYGIYNRYTEKLTFEAHNEICAKRNENGKENPALVRERCNRFQNVLEKFDYVYIADQGVYLPLGQKLAKLVELR